jgi:hypothetical protein
MEIFCRIKPKSKSDIWAQSIKKTFGYSLTPPNFHFRLTNSISYENWHLQLQFDTLLRLLRLKLRSRKVAEVASRQKKLDQKFWNLKFLIYTNIIHLKRKLRIIVFLNWSQISDYFYWKTRKIIWITNFYHLFSTFEKKNWYHLKEGLDKKLMKF